MSKKITVFTGHYGSGKTEIAINFALAEAAKGKKTVICDMDVVNPYFRTKDAQKRLQDAGIRVICPEFANSNVDLPSLPGEINAAFDGNYDSAILDLGGDDDGAVALGQYHARLQKSDYDMLVVANLKRPLTETRQEIVDMVRAIEQASRLTATALINNTNISYETTTEILLENAQELEDAAKELGIPVRFYTGVRDVVANLPGELEDKAFELTLNLNPEWL